MSALYALTSKAVGIRRKVIQLQRRRHPAGRGSGVAIQVAYAPPVRKIHIKV